MAKRILGLEIGNSNIKLLECRQKGGKIFVEKSNIIRTPRESITNGIIWDFNEIYKVLNKEIKEQKYKSEELAIVIKSTDIITRYIRMDKMPPKDMKAILELQYHEYLLVDISEYQVAYKVVGEITDGDSVEQEILIVGAPDKLINPLIEIGEKLKMRIKTINIGSDAISNLFKEDGFIMDMKEESAMVVDIGAISTTVTIISDGVGVLSKDIRMGLQELDSKIINHFGSRQVGDIDDFKEMHGGIFEEDITGNVYQQYMSAKIKPMLENSLAPEIRRLLQFHFSRSKYKKIEKLYIIGGGASIKNIDAYMSDLLGISCAAGIALDITQIDFQAKLQSQSEYFANILGLISEL